MGLLALQSRDPRKICAKRFLADGTVIGYGSPTWWTPIPAPRIDSIFKLYTALLRLQQRRDLIVVRGELINPNAKTIRRAIADKVCEYTGQILPAGLKDADRRWLVCDLDTAEPPESLRRELLADPDRGIERAGKWAMTLLPDWMQGTTTVACWSNSAGLDGYKRAKLHLWLWLDRPVCCASLANYITKIPVLDPAVCRAAQPIYTADPIIERPWPGAPTRRVALIKGEKHAATPPPELMNLADHQTRLEEENRKRQAEADRWKEAARFRPELANRSRAIAHMQRIVARALDEMAQAPESRRHITLVKQAANIVRHARELRLDPRPDLAALERVAIAKLPENRRSEPALAIAYALRTNS
jgi:hypothetical protein